MNRILRNIFSLFGLVLLSGLLVACGGSGSSSSGGGGGGSDDGVYISLDDAPPRNISATAISSSSVQVGWDSPLSGTAVGYFVYRAFGNNYYRITSFGITNTAGPSNTYEDPNLDENTYYCYKVSSYNSSGTESQLSAEACATTLENPGISTTYPNSGDTNIPITTVITVTFEDAMDISTITTDTVKVIASTGDSSGSAVDGSVSYDTGSKIATFIPSGNLAYGVTYTVTLTTGVKTLAGIPFADAYSWSFTTEIDPPAGLTATQSVDAGGGITLSWTPPSAPNVAYYNVYRRTINGSYTSEPDYTSTSSSYADTLAETGNTYCYNVTAVDSTADHNESAPDHELASEPDSAAYTSSPTSYPYCMQAP